MTLAYEVFHRNALLCAASSSASQDRVHVLLIGFYPRLSVWFDAYQPAFHDGSQHEHLKQLAERVLIELPQAQVGRWTIVFAIRLIGSFQGGREDVRQCLVGQLVQFVLIEIAAADGE